MTTVVVVRKGDSVAIAAESLVTFGDTRLSGTYEQNNKILHIGDSYVGLAGSVAHFPVVHSALVGMLSNPETPCRLDSRQAVFDTFVKLHTILKEQYFLNTKEDEDDPYESSQFTAVIANASGIYGVYSYREVFEFDRFWGIGSGRNFALGAMFAAYVNPELDAKAIAELGVAAGCEFDKNSAPPIRSFSIKLAR
ncbi:MFS transporter [Piscinibacterium candidicorallinum]|uniref:MFS transporter n=1 Tax=Piscinibacterium candidicorallinum TaxID=1793872 RepID=A0ABV7H232_9BURK